MKKLTRREFLKGSAAGTVAMALSGFGLTAAAESEETIKVGLLAASSGSTSVLDGYIANAVMMAVDEINEAGGINGKEIEIFREDYASDPATAAEKAEKLIVNDGVSCIVGVVLSSCRQAVLPVVEEYDNLLIYTTDYEGLEQSDNIIYVGCVPNQQIQTIAPYLTENIGQKVYLIGNDYLYPRSTLAQMSAMLEENGAEIVGEEYVAMDETDYTSSITKIINAEPDVVFSVLVGDCITAFQKQYAQYGIDNIEMFHLCLDESGVEAIGVNSCEGVYSGQTYFATVENEVNEVFAAKYEELYGTVPTVYASNGYVAANLLAQALEGLSDEFTTEELVAALQGTTFDGPAGFVTVEENNHCTVTPRIGVVNSEGLFDVIYEAEEPVSPDPYAGEAYYTESES
ncbi:MAG: transporter substrate-binding protein [Lachnospiraceae bacterium]|nr:transporter substrate-binding protein [Lachnospiraceae bacterium]